jgi:uncharacterized spore protein YtfJ
MSIDRLFDTIEEARQAASWQSAFGQPQVVEDKTLIPVAQVGYGFGLGFGSAPQPQAEAETEGEPGIGEEGGGGGGGATSKPLGAIVVTPERVYFEPVEDSRKIALFGIGFAALFVVQLAKTLRAIFGRA